MQKPERCAKHSSLFRPQDAVAVFAPAPLRLFLPQAAPQLRSPPPADVPLPPAAAPPCGGLAVFHRSLTRRLWRNFQAGSFAVAAQPAPRRSSLRFRAPVKGRRRNRGVTLKGWRVGLDYKSNHQAPTHAESTAMGGGLRSRAAACGRNRRGGAGAAVQICKRAASRAAYLGNGNPEGIDLNIKRKALPWGHRNREDERYPMRPKSPANILLLSACCAIL